MSNPSVAVGLGGRGQSSRPARDEAGPQQALQGDGVRSHQEAESCVIEEETEGGLTEGKRKKERLVVLSRASRDTSILEAMNRN